MKNALPRRAHRERVQPHSRTRKGLLEKRKDYVLRAQDYKRKQATLKRLSEKAAERNPDEFYFGMVRRHTLKGVPTGPSHGKEMSVKEVKPLKTQDLAYLRTMRNIERKKIEKLQGMVQGTGSAKGKKIWFAENEKDGIIPF